MSVLSVAVPTGIGDVLWSLTKARALLAMTGAEALRVRICVGPREHSLDRRAFDFLRGLSFVRDVDTVVFNVYPGERHFESCGFLYAPSGPGGPPGVDWTLIANGHLERGGRIEDWLPELATDFDFLEAFVRPPYVAHTLGPYYVLYASQLGFYGGGLGYNRYDAEHPARWTTEDWVRTARLIRERFGGLYQTVIAGAHYDASHADRLCDLLPDVRPLNLCGKTRPGELVNLLDGASFVVGYPSGLLVLSTYLRRPTVMFYNSNPLIIARTGGRVERLMTLPGFATSWVPPNTIGRTYTHLRFGLHGPDDLLREVEGFVERGLVAA